MIYKTLLFIILASSFCIQAQDYNPYEQRRSYPHLYVKNELERRVPDYKELENGHFVSAPAYYDDSSNEEIELYYSLPNGFQKERETVVYFNGGPGQGNHISKSILKHMFFYSEDINIVLIDQRGTGLSVPKNKEIFYNPNLYKSDFIVEDLEKVRADLGLEKWSVVGISWGTLPATKYASKYGKHTKSLILSGVASPFEDTKEENFQDRVTCLNSLVSEVLPNIGLIKDIEKIQKNWLLSGYLSIIDSAGVEGVKEFNKILNSYLSNVESALTSSDIDKMEEKIFPMLNSQIFNSKLFEDSSEKEDLISDIANQHNSYINHITGIKDFMADHKELYDFSLKGDQVSLFKRNGFYHEVSKEIDVKYSEESLFRFEDHPVDIPVFYFTGKMDNSTPFSGAVKHMNIVSSGKSQMIAIEGVGHNPMTPFFLKSKGRIEQYNKLKKQFIANWIKGELGKSTEKGENLKNQDLKFEVISKGI